MKIKTLLLSGLSMALLAAPAFAQTGKPGERLINDDRVPEAPQLKKPIFNKPNVLTQEELDKAPEPPSTDVHQDVHGEDEISDGEMANEGEANVNLDVEVDTQRANFDADEVADDIEDLQEELEDADIDSNVNTRVNQRARPPIYGNGGSDPEFE